MNLEATKKERGLPWFRVDVDMPDHPKADMLSDELGDPNALAYVVRLWAWTMRYAARGRLAAGARLSAERACRWRGEPGALWAALEKTGWVERVDADTFEVHDWPEHNGAAVAKAEKDAERKRAARGRPEPVRGLSADVRADGAGNGTERNGTEHIKAAAAAAAAAAKSVVPLPQKPADRFESGEAYFAWLQNERHEAGFVTEKPPMGLSGWFSEVMLELNGDRDRLDATVAAFGRDPYWRKQNLPMRALMKKWRDYVPAARAS